MKLYIELGDNGWYIKVYYNTNTDNREEIRKDLIKLGCPPKDIRRTLDVATKNKNSAFTFSNTTLKTSLVCISKCTSVELFINTIVHEAKHVLSHICEYYGVSENGETAAYLIGHIVLRMYKMLLLTKQI